MKRLLIALLILFLLSGLVYFLILKNDSSNSGAQEDKVPEFMVKDVLGLTAPLSFFYEKKPVILVFFSPDCGYCDREISDLNKIHKNYKEKIYVIAVVSGKSSYDIKQYAMDKNINFVISSDQSSNIVKAYNISSLPSHIIINKKGKIIKRKNGLVDFNILKGLIKRFI
ncbi:MAG TPA: redoxin domain-containing protein [Patescibacteria group bacterium]|nr:redoxin domain-containing protein [Patescibacteria group bacterium]